MLTNLSLIQTPFTRGTFSGNSASGKASGGTNPRNAGVALGPSFARRGTYEDRIENAHLWAQATRDSSEHGLSGGIASNGDSVVQARYLGQPVWGYTLGFRGASGTRCLHAASGRTAVHTAPLG